VAGERDVAAERRAGRLDLPVEEPRLPRRRRREWNAPLDLLRRLDHRPAAGEPQRSLVVAGDRPDFGQPGAASRVERGRGSLAFQVELPTGDDGYQIVYTRPEFSADSRMAYVGTSTFYRPETSFLYAVDIAGGAPPPPPPPPGPRLCSVPRAPWVARPRSSARERPGRGRQPRSRLAQESREPSVLQHPPAGLAVAPVPRCGDPFEGFRVLAVTDVGADT
jgi:hypothetical protein